MYEKHPQQGYTVHTMPQNRPQPGKNLASGLGLFSIALGVAELVAPHAVARLCGMRPGNASMIRLYGLREIATGVGILKSRNAAPWLWARVAGDMVDLVTLAATSDKRHASSLAKAGAAMTNVAAITAVDAYAATVYKQPADRQAGVDYPDYSDRRGFPRGVEAMRGAALGDFETPRDMRAPEALRPWTHGRDVSDHDEKASGRGDSSTDRSPGRGLPDSVEARAADAVAPQGLVDKV
jgi:hypothetical protein